MIVERVIEGVPAVAVRGEGPGGLEAAFAPSAGMVGCSLQHRGEELLGLRGGMSRYVARRSTMGIPLLHPWANRLGARRFTVAGGEVNLELDDLPLSSDANGLPIHGLLAAAQGWRVRRQEARAGGGILVASFDFAAHPRLLAAFPFPHEIVIEVTLEQETLTIATTVHATGEAPVPISFGFHPYLRLPGVDREAWQVELPVHDRLELDRSMLPTGRREPVEPIAGPLGGRAFDDAFLAPPPGEPFVLAGGGRRIELVLGPGFPFAQVYAPREDDVIAFEPMTAPTNSLLAGGPSLPIVEPGDSFSASFSITVGDDRR